MRLLTLTVFVALLAGSINSQIIFQEDFDGIGGPTSGGAGTYTFPSGWFLRNVDNLAPAGSVSYVNEAWERREDFSFNVTDSCAFSTSWYNPAGTADDWMWTPAIQVLDQCVLRWNAITYDPLYRDGYEVRLKTVPPTGGTGVIGNQLDSDTLLIVPAENTSWTTREVSLEDYDGQTVYIGFRNNSNDRFLLLIDDVIVERIVDYDASLTAINKQEYTRIPATQEYPFGFQGTARNDGIQDLTNVILNVDVYDESNSLVFSASSAPHATLQPNQSVNLTAADTFMPSASGIYTLRYFVDADETDEDPENDTLVSSIEISDFTYARDNEVIIGALGIGAGNGFLGQQYAITNNSTLKSFSVYLTTAYLAPHHMGASVYRVVNKVPEYVPLYEAPVLTIPVDGGSQWYEFNIPGGLDLLAGDTILIAGEEKDSTIQIGQTNMIFTPQTQWVKWSGNPLWTPIENFGSGFQRTFMIRAELVIRSCEDGIMNQGEEGIDCGGLCDPCLPPDAECGIITYYVNPSTPAYDGPGNNNIWLIPSAQLDAGSFSAYPSPNIDVKRYQSTLTFDWTTNGACIDIGPNGGPISNPDKGTVYRDCLPVRNADFNTWKLYQLRIQDNAGSDECHGMIRVVPSVGAALVDHAVIHSAIPNEEHTSEESPDAQYVAPELILVPNPGTDELQIHWTAQKTELVNIRITDLNGNVIVSQEVQSFGGQNSLRYLMNSCTPGVYLVTMYAANFHQTRKWIKAN